MSPDSTYHLFKRREDKQIANLALPLSAVVAGHTKNCKERQVYLHPVLIYHIITSINEKWARFHKYC